MIRTRWIPTGLARFGHFIDVMASIATIVAAGALVYALVSPKRADAGPAGSAGNRRPLSVPDHELSLKGAEIRGSTSAPLAMIEFSEFQCPFCGKFATEVMPTIDRDFIQSGKLLFAFRNLPLSAIHAHALRAAQVASCAGKQGKFWQMHDRLFTQQTNLEEATFLSDAHALSLDGRSLQSCLDAPPDPRIQEDVDLAKSLGVSGTPTFFVGSLDGNDGVKVSRAFAGVQSIETLEKILKRIQ